MHRQRNLLPFAGFAVCLLAAVSYFLVFAQFPLTRDVPWVNWLLFTAGLGLLGVGLVRPFRSPERYRGRIAAPILTALSLAVVGLFLFYTLSLSRQLPASAGVPQVGERAPDFTLPDHQGKPVRLYDLLGAGAAGAQGPAGNGAPGSWVVLVFYRGYW